jgi:hypothetical protein
MLALEVTVLSLASAWGASASDLEMKMPNIAADGQRGVEAALVLPHPGGGVHFMTVDDRPW